MTEIFPNQLSSRRLILRRLEYGDVSALCDYRGLPEVARYQSWEAFSLDDALRLIQEQSPDGPGIPGKWFQMAIIKSVSGEMIGDCGLLCRQEDPRQMEVGITLAPAHHRYGYASEALECLMDFVFGVLLKHRVLAVTDAENSAAISLFKRLGFRQEAHFREHVWFKGRWSSEFVFALLRREWVSRRGSGET